MLVVMYTD